MAPPLPIPNREVKRCSADDTIFNGKVGSRQDREENSIKKKEKQDASLFSLDTSTIVCCKKDAVC